MEFSQKLLRINLVINSLCCSCVNINPLPHTFQPWMEDGLASADLGLECFLKCFFYLSPAQGFQAGCKCRVQGMPGVAMSQNTEETIQSDGKREWFLKLKEEFVLATDVNSSFIHSLIHSVAHLFIQPTLMGLCVASGSVRGSRVDGRARLGP